MNINTNFYKIPSREGEIAIWDSKGNGTPVLFIHGNSSSKEIFSHQFESELAIKYRFIAIDLPGHGESDPAENPHDAYTIEGYAKVIMEVINHLELSNPAVVGWSLGGHIGIDLLQKMQKLAGLLITGTPAIKISFEGFQNGFQFNPEVAHLFSKEKFTEEEAGKFMQSAGFDVENEPFITQGALKTDGRARVCLSNSISKGIGGDQKATVETNDTPLCVIQGEKDCNLKIDYIINEIKYKNLFNNKVYVIKNANHSLVRSHSKKFNSILDKFLTHVYGRNS